MCRSEEEQYPHADVCERGNMSFAGNCREPLSRDSLPNRNMDIMGTTRVPGSNVNAPALGHKRLASLCSNRGEVHQDD